MIRFINLLLCAICFLSCGRRPKTGKIFTSPPLEINLDSSSLLSISEKIDVKSVVPLECSDSAIISSSNYIKRILYVDNRLFLLDVKYMAIKVFDTAGHYLYSIGRLGTNRGQFSYIEDIIYNASRQSLMVLCNTPNKIIEFSLKGTVLNETILPFFASDFTYKDGLYYFFLNQNTSDTTNSKNLIITNSDMEVQSELFDIPSGLSISFSFTGGLFTMDSLIYFNPPFQQTIYELSNGNATPRYYVNFEAGSDSTKLDYQSIQTQLHEIDLLNKNMIQQNEYLAFNYTKRRRKELCIFNEKDNKIYSSESGRPIDKFFNEGVFLSNGVLMLLLTPSHKESLLSEDGKNLKTAYPEIYNRMLNYENCSQPLILVFDFVP